MRLLCGRRLRDDRGSQLIEVAVGVSVMAVAVISVVGAMGSGMQLVGHSRQRSAGSSVAVEKLERMRNLPFDEVALLAGDPAHPMPVHNADPGHPNNKVSVDGLYYRVEDGTPADEELVMEPTGGLWHEEDPLDIGGTEFRVLQYVTWQQEPSVKRIIVVVHWKFPVATGQAHQVTQSTLVTDGTVTVPDPTPTPAPTPGPASSGTPAPSAPPPSAPPDCNGASVPRGALELLSGSGGAEVGYTSSSSVQVQITATHNDCLDVMAELSNTGPDGPWTPVVLICTKQCGQSPPRTGMGAASPATVAWTIAGGDGPRTIHLRLIDGAKQPSPTGPDYTRTITLDESIPTPPPGSFQQSACEITGTSRTITFTWTASSDANFRGHRLYRSIESGSFTSVGTVAGSTITDTEQKGYNSVRYYVVGYDKAGNESDDSNVLSYSKNSCG